VKIPSVEKQTAASATRRVARDEDMKGGRWRRVAGKENPG
jgi:hypothetical protein